MADYYRIHHREKGKRKGRIIAVILAVIFLIFLIWLGFYIRDQLQPKTQVTQSKAVVKKVSYDTKTKRFDEGDFVIDFPTTWVKKPRPEGPYKSFTWQNSGKNADYQKMEIFEDVIPVNFAVNRMQVVESAGEQVRLVDTASDNCEKYTKGANAVSGQVGVPAKWLGVDFLCDKSNTLRNIIGTSSTDGINTVILKSPNSGVAHKFFFTFTDNTINPDYTVYYEAIQSFRMQ